MRKKFKNAAKLIVVFMILATCTKCQKDDDVGQTNDKTLLFAKEWFKNYEAEGSNYELFQNLDYDWNNAAITNSEDGTKTIIVPINEIKKDPIETWKQNLYIYKLSENNYEALLFEIYPDSKNTDPNSSLIDSGIFNGYITAWDLKKGFVKAALFENGTVAQNGSIKVYSKNKAITSKAPSNKANCPAGIECDTDGSGDTGTELKEVVINNNCQNPSGYVVIYNNGGSGYTGDTSPGGYTNHGTGASSGSGESNIEITPPSCESFNFTSKKGANWQEAAVKNINFKIVLLTPPNHIQITQVISFPQATSFGMPINYNKGNGVITSGVAATVSARILQLAMDETVAKFGKTETSELTVRLYFQDKLIKEYQEYTNGGKVNFNSTSNIPATQYKTNLLSSGNCD
ncbi:hypothetical protein [Flavobacterium ginsengiterrae]|uniref:Lipoprotein n=1 Tax=Flavobacterium ginsengiterrae TaxID=871695 RepID=A0ABP7H1T6_9FLAO